MKTILSIIMAAMIFTSAHARKYSYTFNDTPIFEAILRISKSHPDGNISVIFKEPDTYKTSAKVHIDNKETKNTSQTATYLLARTAIQQLRVSLSSSIISTASGQPVALYKNMCMQLQQNLK